MVVLRAENGMLELRLHESLYKGLLQAAGLRNNQVLTDSESDRLERWADTCDNPSGQRAALARTLANLLRVSRLVVLREVPEHRPGGLWEAVAT